MRADCVCMSCVDWLEYASKCMCLFVETAVQVNACVCARQHCVSECVHAYVVGCSCYDSVCISGAAFMSVCTCVCEVQVLCHHIAPHHATQADLTCALNLAVSASAGVLCAAG